MNRKEPESTKENSELYLFLKYLRRYGYLRTATPNIDLVNEFNRDKEKIKKL